MRTISLLLMTCFACACDGSATPPHPPAPPDVESQIPEPWPIPSVERTNLALDIDRLDIVIEAPDAHVRVEARLAHGPTPPPCDGGEPTALSAHGSTRRLEAIATRDSATICVYDSEDRVRAHIESRGFRSVPMTRTIREEDHIVILQTLGELDADVDGIAYVAFPAPEEDRDHGALPLLECVTEAGDGDPPRHCRFDCAGGRVVSEVPRAILDRITSSQAFRAQHEDADLLYPDTLSVRFPIALERGEGLATCVRTRDTLETDLDQVEHIGGFDDECALESPGGCPSGYGPLVAGDVLYGTDEAGLLSIESTVRTARAERGHRRMIQIEGAHLEVFSDERVVTPTGEVVASALEVGMSLLRFGRPVTILDIRDTTERGARLDLAGATHYRSRGFTVRDAGDPEPVSPPRASPTFHAQYGNGDCAIEARWIAASSDRDVTLSVRALSEDAARFGRATASCDAPLITIDADVSRAVAEIDPRAEIVVQLFGEEVQCGGAYAVSRCAETSDALYAEASGVCLPAGTLIDTREGTRAIEKLRRGEVILSFDAERGVRPARVLGVTSHDDRPLLEVVLDDGTRLEATPEHVFMAGDRREPRTARTLEPGDLLTVRQKDRLAFHRITSIEATRRATVYELRVSAPDTYFANRILVHNY